MVQIITVDSGSGGLCIKKTDDFIILIFPSLATGQQGCVCVKSCIGLSCVLWACKAKS